MSHAPLPRTFSRRSAFRLHPLCMALALTGLHGAAGALPQGAQVVNGQVGVTARPGNAGAPTLDIRQSTNHATIDWKSFSIGAGERVDIFQPGAQSVLLNRVVGGDPSIILGQLNANGRVFLSNPRGIVFGAGSQVDVGSLLATTLDIASAGTDKNPGRYQLFAAAGAAPGSLRADGAISAPGGTIALVAPQLSVNGTLTASRVGLAAASSVLVDVEGDGLIFFDARNDGLDARLNMLGAIHADGGSAELRAQARAGFADTVLNMDGIVQARSLGGRAGQVVIDGGGAGITEVSGTVDVSGRGAGQHGGTATVLGHDVGLFGAARIDASGDQGGGAIRVGGDFHGQNLPTAARTYAGAGTSLSADAGTHGDGGSVVVWSDQVTRDAGQLSARGGAQGGHGGQAEISSHGALDFQGTADLRAPHGKTGQLLLDPLNLTIQAAVPDLNGDGTTLDDLASPTLAFGDFTGATSVITGLKVTQQLDTADVLLEATNDIHVNIGINASLNTAVHSLTLHAGHDIDVNAGLITRGGDIVLDANHDFSGVGGPAASGTGTLTVGAAVLLDTTGGGQTGGNLVLSGKAMTLGTASALHAGQDASLTADALSLPAITAGGKIVATARAGTITQFGALTAGADGSGFTTSSANQAIDLSTSTNSFGTHGVAFHTTGTTGDVDVKSDGLNLGASTVGGKLTANATTGDIAESGAVTTATTGSGFTVSAGHSIDLSTQANHLAGSSTAADTFTGATNLGLRDTGDVQIAATTLSGKLVAISDGGNITQSGAISVGADGSAFITSTAAKTIDLSTSTNAFGAHTVAFDSASGGDVAVTSDALKFAATTIGGKLTATAATGTITEGGAISTGADGSVFTTSTAGQAIDLSTSTNAFGTHGVGFNTTGAADVAVKSDALVLGASGIGGKLTATAATGGIEQNGAITVGANGSSFTASTSGQAIDLSTSTNAFGSHDVALNTSGASGDAAIKSDSLVLAASTVGGKLVATAATGTLTQNGVLSTGTDGSAFTTSTANQAIDLSTSTNAFGTHSVAFNTSGTTGDVSVKSDSLNLGASTVHGKLTANATTGDIGESGAVTTSATGSGFTVSAGHSVDLSTQANHLAGSAAAGDTFTGATNVGLRDTGDIQLGATTLSGKLVAISDGGNITQSGVLSVGADGSGFTTSTAAKTIDLSTSTNAFGAHTVAFHSASGGDVAVTSDGLKFAASTIGGKLTATAATGTVTQSGAISTGADGSVFTTSTAAQAIDLSTSTNSFGAHSVGFNTTGAADVAVKSDALVLGASGIGGKLTATAATGGVAQNGVITTGANGSSFTASTAGQTIDLSTSTNAFGSHDVALNTSGAAGNAAIKSDSLVLAASTVGGKLTATAASGGIAQSGALSTGADGSAFTTSTANQAIDLSTSTNVFGTHSVAFDTAGTTGDVSVKSNSLNLGASTVLGKLTANATTGDITESGAVTTAATGSGFTVSAGHSIDLSTQANHFAGSASGGDSFSGATDVSLRDTGAIQLGAVSVAGKLVVVSDTGGITQSGAIATGADGSSFTTSASGQAIDLSTSTNAFGAHTVGFHTSGAAGNVAVKSDALNLAASSVGGTLAARATTGGIAEGGALTTGVAGSSFTVDTAGQSIDLSTQANHLAGSASAGDTFVGATDLGLRDTGAIRFAGTTLAGKLVAVSDTGGISQAGAIATGADGSRFTTSASGQSIDLSTSTNAFGAHTVGFHTSGAAGNVAVRSNALNLAASTVGGTLAAQATSGDIVESGTVSTGVAGSAFTVSAGHSIDLGTQANTLAGSSTAGNSFVGATDLGLRDTGAIRFAATTLAGKLVAVSDTGGITQSGAISVGADGSRFTTSTAGQAIDLSTQANSFGAHTVGFDTSGATGDAAIRSNALNLATSTVGGKLVAIATTGAITQSGAIATGADGSLFTTSAAHQTIDLSTSTNAFGARSVSFATNGSGADAKIKSDALTLGASTVGGALQAEAVSGDIAESGALTAAGGSFLVGSGHSIDLSTQANQFSATNLSFSGAANLALRNVGTIDLGPTSLTGALLVTSDTGSITQSGALSVGADGSGFTTSAAGQSIDLSTQANTFGTHTVAFHTTGATGNAAVRSDALNLAASTVGGALQATADTGGIAQSGAITVGADGSRFTTSAAGQSIDLSTQANAFGAHAVGFATSGAAGHVAVRADALRLAASSIGGALQATAASGTITQSGAISLGADGSRFTTQASGASIDLSNASNTFGMHSVGFSTTGAGGDVAVASDSLKLGASGVGGKLTASAASGGISQSGAFAVGADGSSFSAAAPGQAIDLSTSTNTLNGHTVAFHTSGSGGAVGLKADTLNLAASQIGGAFSATVSGGPVGQTGDVSVGGLATLTADTASLDAHLARAGNDFGAVSFTATNGGHWGTLDVVDANALTVGGNATTLNASAAGALTLAGGGYTTLNATGQGAIAQTGAIAVGGITTLATSTAGTAVDLSTNGAANEFHVVTLAPTGGGSFAQVAVLDRDQTGADGLQVGGDAVGLNVASGGAVNLNGGSYGSVAVRTGGGLTQSGAVTANSLQATATAPALDLGLNDAGNSLASVGLSTGGAGSWRNATVVSTAALSVGGDAATLNLDAGGALNFSGGQYGTVQATTRGPVTQTGSLAASGALTLATPAAQVNVNLSDNGLANELNSLVLAPTGAGSFGAVRVNDHDAHADGLNVSGSAASLNVTAGGAVTLAGGSYGDLGVDTSASAAGAGAVGQTGALAVSGLAQVAVNGSAVTFALPTNDFASVALQHAGTARVADANGFALGASSIGTQLTLESPGAVALAGTLSGSGALVKAGAGTLSVNGAQTYAGGTTIVAGTLSASGAASLGAGALTVASGAVLDANQGASLPNAVISQGGTLRDSNGEASLTGPVALSANTTLNVAGGGVLTIAGDIDGASPASSLVKTGAGTARLQGGGGAGGVQVQEGALIITSAQGLPPGANLDVSGGATLGFGADLGVATLTGNGQVVLDGARLSVGAAGGDSTFAGQLSGSGGLTKAGAGTLTMSGANTYLGATQVDGGKLATSGAALLPSNSALNLGPAGTLSLGGDQAVGALAGGGTVRLNGHRLDAGGNGASTAFSGRLAGSGGFTKSGAGTLALSGTSTYDAPTRIDGGRLQLASADALPATAALAVATNAVLELGADATVGALSGAGTVVSNGHTLSAASNADSVFGGAVTGSGGLRKSGTGNLTLSGANDYTGATAIDDGTLTVGGTLSNVTAVTVAAPANLVLGTDLAVGSLSGAGQVRLGANRLTTGADGADTVFAGVISGTGALTKVGAGTLALTGDNLYTGNTAISGGVLQVGAGGPNAAGGTLGAGAVTDDAVLRFARSDAVQVGQAIGGSGALEVAQGQVTLTSTSNTYAGMTRVDGGELRTDGAGRLPESTAVHVAAGARLTLGGSQTLDSIDADGAVAALGDVHTAGDQRYRGGLTLAASGATTLSGNAIDAGHAGNDLGDGTLSVQADSAQLLTAAQAGGGHADLALGDVVLGHGGRIGAGRVTFHGLLSLAGGTLALTADASPDPAQAVPGSPTGLAQSPGTGKPIAYAQDTVTQADGSRIAVASGALLNVVASGNGSVTLAQDANQFLGGLSVLSGPAFDTPWQPNVVGAQSIQSRATIYGDALRFGGAGLEADTVYLRANTLNTAEGAAIAARLPFDNLALGTTASVPSMTFELAGGAFGLPAPFGQSNTPLNIVVGARSIGNRTTGPDAGFLRVLPKNGAQGAIAVFVAGPKVGSGSGYEFFHDGATQQRDIPVFYNGILPQTPQVSGSLSAVAAVSESARRDRFEEAVRTENVSVRLRSGVIAEVGPGRPATVGTQGAAAPESCTPGAGLQCAVR